MYSTTSNLARTGHISHFMRCLTGLPASKTDLDTSRLGIAYYCLSGLDLLGVVDEKIKINDMDRMEWRDWIWNLSVQSEHGFGFRPGYSLEGSNSSPSSSSQYDPPHLIMTYTALLSLTILRDDFSRLNRPRLIAFLRSTQHLDGRSTQMPRSYLLHTNPGNSFSSFPIGSVSSERDLRLTFCICAICSMLDDWSGINVDAAVEYINRCRTYEGGYGESPGRESQGGSTYCALASLRLISDRHSLGTSSSQQFLSASEVKQTLRWLTQKQKSGFQGRTEKKPDACYCFWCGASIKLLGGEQYVANDANTDFLYACQYKYGGIAKEPGETPDPYHTYLSLASLSLYHPTEAWLTHNGVDKSAWRLPGLDPLINLRVESMEWARKCISGQEMLLE
ncbi:terpenoid cyclases/Protein prenyltransferase [Ramaria rubella]|nr:terpenoid cyclases/Protein prenyltransferase [Ramaria rubella]